MGFLRDRRFGEEGGDLMLLVHQWRSAIGGLARRSHCRASQSVTQCVCVCSCERERVVMMKEVWREFSGKIPGN